MQDTTDSTNHSLEKEEQATKNIENTEKLFSNNEEELENDLNLGVGSFEEAPKFMQDNEYIKTGYLLNCTDFKKTFKSLFMCHNETVNIWSHLLAAIFFFFLIFYTSIFVSNYKSQLINIKKDILAIEEDIQNIYNDYPNIMNNSYHAIKDIKNIFNIFDKNIYEDSVKTIIYLYDEIKNLTSNAIEYLSEKISIIKDKVFILKEKILNLIKLDNSKSKNLESELDEKYNTNLKNRKPTELARWPLFIIIHAAILCFIFSATFHSIGTINERYHDILNRFDYGGISLLISGSCYPPYYYFFYYSKTFKYFYLIEVTVFGIGTFLYSLTDSFNKPNKRTLRGTIFLVFGLCTGIPILHMAFFGDRIEGYSPGIKLINWYLGGASYVIGALFYILRFPEKKFQIKFDYIGASHQIFHVLVFFGALFHFFGSLDAYNYRFDNLKSY